MTKRTLAALLVSIAVVLGGGYLLFRMYQQPGMRQPTPSEEKPSLPDEKKEQLDVTLPEDLQQELDESKQRQSQLFDEAVEAHSQGDYETAINRYREAISYSGQDTIAARSYRYLGDIYSRDESYDQAIRLYEFALRIQPENPVFHYRLGLTYKEKGSLTKAADALDQAVQYGDRSEYYLARGNLHFEEGEYAQAEEMYESGIEAGGNLDSLYSNLALTRERLDEPKNAIEAYSRALEQELGQTLRYEVYLNKGKLHMGQEQYQEATAAFESARRINETTEALYNLGLARAEKGELAEAADTFRSALEESPRDAKILMDLGRVHEKLEQYAEAVNYYEQALDEQPENTDLLLALGRLHERLGDNRTALGYYQRLVEKINRGPQLMLTFRRVGELYLSMGEPAKAQPAFRNVLSMDSGVAEVHYNLGIAYRRDNSPERAIEEFRRATDLNPESVQYQVALSDSLYRAGYRREAQDAYRRVVELDDSRNDAKYMIALLHYQWGDLDEARRKFQSLVEQLDNGKLLVKTYQNLGNIYLRDNDLSRAETSYRQALEIQKNPGTYFNLGLIYSRRENWDVAATVFRKALQEDESNPNYQAALGLVLYQKALYQEAKGYLSDALSADPDNLRNHYNRKKLQQTLDDINARVSGT